MNQKYSYEIRVEGHLTDLWQDWFEGLSIQAETGGVTLLSGSLPDQAALLGLLNKLQALNLILISVKRMDD